MKQLKQSIKGIDIVFILLNLAIIVYLIMKGEIITSDSATYIDNRIYRTFTYPLLLDLFELIFRSTYLFYIVCFQIFFSFASVLFLSITLKKYFHLGRISFYLIYLIILTPNFMPMLQISNFILTESITYSFFLIYIVFIIKNTFELRLKDLVWLLIFSTLATSTRPQFIFLYGVNILLIIFNYYKSRHMGNFIAATILLLVLILGNSFCQKSYNYYIHGEFTKIPFFGIIFTTTQLYLSTPSDINLFDNPEQIEFLKIVYKKIDFAKANNIHNHTKNGFFEHAAHYRNNFNSILKAVLQACKGNKTIDIIGIKTDLSSEHLMHSDQLTSSLMFKLFKANFAKYARLFIANINYGIGGYYYVFFLFSAWCFFVYMYLKTRETYYFIFLCVTIIHLMNNTLIAIVQPVIRRFSFYTDTLQWAIMVVFLSFVGNQLLGIRKKEIEDN